MDLVCLGELLVDMFPAETGRRIADVTAFQPKPGGAPANVAVAAARLGARSAFIGKVGADAFGQRLADILVAEGVATQGIRFDDGVRTTLAFIAKPDASSAEFLFYRNPGADTRLRSDELDRELLAHAAILHFGSLSLCEEPIRSAAWEAVRLARAAGALISFDVNFRPTLWNDPVSAAGQIAAILPQADLVKVNEAELALLARGHERTAKAAMPSMAEIVDTSQELLSCGPRLVVVTLGAHGSYFCSVEGAGFVPAFDVPTVDATGCGDAFVAGLLCRLLTQRCAPAGIWQPPPPASLSQSLRYANAVAALTACTLGVIPALPTADEVQMFLRRHDSTVPTAIQP